MGGKRNQGQIKHCLNCGKEEYVHHIVFTLTNFVVVHAVHNGKAKMKRLKNHVKFAIHYFMLFIIEQILQNTVAMNVVIRE